MRFPRIVPVFRYCFASNINLQSSALNNMPAKQGTLKYVRSGQQTLGCANIQHLYLLYLYKDGN
jgi:hypothetical protein